MRIRVRSGKGGQETEGGWGDRTSFVFVLCKLLSVHMHNSAEKESLVD